MSPNCRIVGSAKYPGTMGLALPGASHAGPATADGIYSVLRFCAYVAVVAKSKMAIFRSFIRLWVSFSAKVLFSGRISKDIAVFSILKS